MFVTDVIDVPNKDSVIQSILNRIITECDIRSDGVLTGNELQNCGRLLQPGLFLDTLFEDKDLVPEIHGTCGNMIGSEYASPDSLQTSLFDQRPWSLRVKLAIAILDYIQELEHTEYGTLYLCDLQWKNLGIVTDSNGRMKIKSIDNDESFFENIINKRINSSRTCKIDHDCCVASCAVECNTTTNMCSRRFSSNNLQVCT